MNLNALFDRISAVSVGVIGDFCLDVYWRADMKRAALSRETPHFNMPIVEERMSPGGAGNVAINLAALAPARVVALGAIGRDWRGEALVNLLKKSNVDVDALITDPERVTNAYIKPLRGGISEALYEDPRLDFENYSPLGARTEAELLNALARAKVDIWCVCDQMLYGCVTESIRNALCELGKAGARVVADSRDRIGLYKHVIVKPNEVEAARAVGDSTDYADIARRLSEQTGKPALVTLGSDGCVICENGRAISVPARRAEPPIDICGAGDTFISALALALAAGCALHEAASFACAASAVTIKKLNQTGTATREEIRAIWNT